MYFLVSGEQNVTFWSLFVALGSSFVILTWHITCYSINPYSVKHFLHRKHAASYVLATELVAKINIVQSIADSFTLTYDGLKKVS